MKIDILSPPPSDIFKDRRRQILAFSVLLALACGGLLLGVYAVVSDTKFYDQLEIAALGLFAGSALCLAYFGEKLQDYKKLTPPQQKELAALGRKHAAIQHYSDLVARANRQPIRAEYEACQEWAELTAGRTGEEYGPKPPA
jgi:hypothetical protein